MTDEPEPIPEMQRVSEEEGRELLELAIHFDAKRSAESSVAELRRIAEELNIAPAAFDEALRVFNERHATERPAPTGVDVTPTRPTRVQRLLGVLRTVVVWDIGFITAVLTVRGQDLGTTAFVLLLVSGALALHHRKTNNLRGYLIDMAALWLSATLGWVARGQGQPPLPNDQLLLFIGWLAAMGLGSAAVRMKGPRQPNTDPQNLTAHPA